eukprot:scaffold310_cov307-Pinguiococcus_pyrenoidosus.AAC.15
MLPALPWKYSSVILSSELGCKSSHECSRVPSGGAKGIFFVEVPLAGTLVAARVLPRRFGQLRAGVGEVQQFVLEGVQQCDGQKGQAADYGNGVPGGVPKNAQNGHSGGKFEKETSGKARETKRNRRIDTE